jgi:hypothetical protein
MENLRKGSAIDIVTMIRKQTWRCQHLFPCEYGVRASHKTHSLFTLGENIPSSG